MNRFLRNFLIAFIPGFVFLIFPDTSYSYEHPRYYIHAEVNVDQKKITARQEVIFTNNTNRDIKELYFHLYPNRKYKKQEKELLLRYAGYFKINPFPDGFQAGRMEIHSIQKDSLPLTFSIGGEDQTILKVPLEEMLSPNQSVKISIDFSVDIPHAYGRFGWHKNIVQLSRFYPILSVHDQEGWHPYPFYPFHRPFFSEAAHYSIDLVVPQDQIVIHSGELITEQLKDEHRKTLTIISGCPIREFTIAMSPDYKVVEDQSLGFLIKSYYLTGDEFYGKEALKSAKELMQYYTEHFGKYENHGFSIAPVYLGYGGEQMSNLIFIDTRVYKLPKILRRYFDFLISHETGHQWFYNLVGIDEFTQMWLEEGVHSYFIQKYLEDKYGKEADIIEYPDWFKGWEWTLPRLTFKMARDCRYQIITRMGLDNAVIGELSSFREPSSIFSLTYGKGARIVAMLESLLGEETFDRIFKRVFQEFRFKNLKLKEFITLCEQESRRELSWFFDQWLSTKKSLDHAVKGMKENKIFFENRGDAIMPAEVKVYFRDGRQKIYPWDGKKEIMNVEDPNPIERVQVDPQEKMLDIDRTNNYWPRQIQLKAVPIYLGLYDIPVFLPNDQYNVVVGPELANNGLGLKASFQKPYDHIFYTGSDYEFSENLHHSRFGYQIKNLLRTQTTTGFELANTTDHDGGEEDLTSGQVYIRWELWPAQYGFADINDHISFYLLRQRSLKDPAEFFTEREHSRGVNYHRRNESLGGISFHLNRSGPYPDPTRGYQLDIFVESAGHFLGATQYFNRTGGDFSIYQPVTPKSQLAFRLKYGLGYPDDKDLFHLGGIDGLRGYERKSIRGANSQLGSIEYRFPLKEDMGVYGFDHILGLEKVAGVVFFDAGQTWLTDFEDLIFKKDAGVGLRFTVNIGSFLEKLVIRMDVAWPIRDKGEDDPRVWFGLNHTF